MSLRKLLVAAFFTSTLIANSTLGLPRANMEATSSVDESAKKVDAFLAQWDKTDLPGCALGAIKDGKFVYKRAFGLANLDHDVPNTTSTRFNLASVSKPFTAMSVALLAKQGKISLDDDVRKYVPEIPEYRHTVTIRHLIHHTSGLREYQALVLFGGLNTDNAYDNKSIMRILSRQKNLSFVPGSKYQYSNSGYLLLGIIVERVSGKSLREFAEENIFGPLGMKNTLYFDDRFEVVKNRAHGYQVSQDKKVKSRSSLFDLVGAGGVLTNIDDLYYWTQNYYEPVVGDKELIRQITTPGTLNNGHKISYAFGAWRIEYKGLPVIEHSGNMMGYRAKIFSFPEQKFTSIALCNNMAILPSTIASKLADIYLENELKSAAPAQKPPAPVLPTTTRVSEKDATRYTGTYAHIESGNVLRLSVKDGKLVESSIFKKDVPVLAASENRLIVAEGYGMTELHPISSNSGEIAEIRIMKKDGMPDVFVPVQLPQNSPQQLSEYTGAYYSDELDAHYTLVLKRDALVVQISDTLQPTLAAEYADAFSAANGEIKFLFTRDTKGKISGFVFNSGVDNRDVKGVQFRRK